MENRQQILDFTRQMLREKRYDEARKLLRALPSDDATAQQWLAQINERERAEHEANAALTGSPQSGSPLAQLRRQGRSLRDLLSRPKPPSQPPPKRKRTPQQPSDHPLAAPPEAKAPPAAAPEAQAEPDALFFPEREDATGPKIRPDELPVGTILARSLVMAGVVIGVVVIILLFLGG